MQPRWDPIVASLLPEFCAQWERSAGDDRWEGMHQAGDTDALYRFGHTVRGSFAQFGIAGGPEIGRALMECARSGDWAEARVLMTALRGRLHEVLAQLPEGAGAPRAEGELTRASGRGDA